MAVETQEYEFKHPFDVVVPDPEKGEGATKTVTVEKTVITPPKGKRLREISRLVSKVEADPTVYCEADLIMDCIQIMSDLPEDAIDEVEAVDIRGLGEIAGPFLEVVLGAGPSQPSPSGSAKTSPK